VFLQQKLESISSHHSLSPPSLPTHPYPLVLPTDLYLRVLSSNLPLQFRSDGIWINTSDPELPLFEHSIRHYYSDTSSPIVTALFTQQDSGISHLWVRSTLATRPRNSPRSTSSDPQVSFTLSVKSRLRLLRSRINSWIRSWSRESRRSNPPQQLITRTPLHRV
jgi:hypothetical protein